MEEKTHPTQTEKTEPTPKIAPKKHFVLNKTTLAMVATVILLVIGTSLLLLRQPTLQTTQKITTFPQPTMPAPTATDWKTYINTEAGFSLKYPSSVLFEAETKGTTQPILLVGAEKLSSIPEDLPSLMGRNDALKQKADLEKGNVKTAVKIGSLYGSLGMITSQFEICSVILNRSLTFYPGDYRVIISLAGPEKEIMDSMPEFFAFDKSNCGDKKVWNRSNPKSFTETLANKQGVGMAQQWYDTFDEIVKTITLTTPTASTPSGTISNNWPQYKNMQYGFEISYPSSYRALDSKNDLSGYSNGVVLLYTGGQAYDVIVEIWNTQAAYESAYSSRMSDLTVVKSKDKFITLLDNTQTPENKKVIATFKLLPE